jgi:uncharacterized cofD-like protein
MKVVGIGGGTGLPVLLSGLKTLRERREIDVDITAIVAVSDSGGSTGDLRRALGIPAVGDIRNCLVALGNCDPGFKELCQHRFQAIEGLSGHSAGNLLLAALYQMSGDFEGMVRLASNLFRTSDAVRPSTNAAVTLCAEYFDGTCIRGEANIPLKRAPIRKVWLDPECPLPADEIIPALAAADVIVLGPGSLYTSIIPNLLVADVADAIHASSAVKVYVCNLMTQTGETEEFSAADHLRTLQSYLPAHTIDVCVLNTRSARSQLAARYSKAGSRLVSGTADEILRLGVVPESAELLHEENIKIRHDGLALARLVAGLANGRKEWEVLCAES